MQLTCLYADNLTIQLPTHHCAPPVALHSEVGTEEQVCDSQEQRLGQWPRIFIIFISLKSQTEEQCQVRVSKEHTVTPVCHSTRRYTPQKHTGRQDITQEQEGTKGTKTQRVQERNFPMDGDD